jgi:hypothetical protein
VLSPGMPSSIGGTPSASAISRAASCRRRATQDVAGLDEIHVIWADRRGLAFLLAPSDSHLAAGAPQARRFALACEGWKRTLAIPRVQLEYRKLVKTGQNALFGL